MGSRHPPMILMKVGTLVCAAVIVFAAVAAFPIPSPTTVLAQQEETSLGEEGDDLASGIVSNALDNSDGKDKSNSEATVTSAIDPNQGQDVDQNDFSTFGDDTADQDAANVAVPVATSEVQTAGGEGGGGSSPHDISLQVTERTNSLHIPIERNGSIRSVSAQCNSDETVSGGGFSFEGNPNVGAPKLLESRKQGNAWFTEWAIFGFGFDIVVPPSGEVVITAHAECLKIVPATE